MSDEVCKSCKFYLAWETLPTRETFSEGVCRRYPPTIPTSSTDIGLPVMRRVYFGLVRENYWCGEWKAKKTATVTDEAKDQRLEKLSAEQPELECRNCECSFNQHYNRKHFNRKYDGYCLDCIYSGVPAKDAEIRVLRKALRVMYHKWIPTSPMEITCHAVLDDIAKDMIANGKCTEQEAEYIRRACDE